MTWTIVDLLGFTREDVTVTCGVYRNGTGSLPILSGLFLPADRIVPWHDISIPSFVADDTV
jgi:hypothetical protein